MYKILHISTSLGMGGAETSLYNLLKNTDRSEFALKVLSLGSDQPLGDRIRSLEIPVVSLGMKPSWPDIRALIRLVRFMRDESPDLVQTWMYHADLMGVLAASLAENPPVVWGIHMTLDEISRIKWPTRLVIFINALLSRWMPAAIVYCAEASRRSHAAIGYAEKHTLVIPNGFNLDDFKPDGMARVSVHTELGLPPDTFLLGMAARYHPQKDHQNFIHSAALLKDLCPDVHFLLWGKDVEWQNPALASWIDAAGLRERFHLLGMREDAPRLTAALDVATLSSSYGEAFPMVLGEAMACGIPCAATDIGDIAEMIDGVGKVVPPRDPSALAQAWLELLQMPVEERQRLGDCGRRKVMERYEICQTAAQYARLHRDIIEHRQR